MESARHLKASVPSACPSISLFLGCFAVFCVSSAELLDSPILFLDDAHVNSSSVGVVRTLHQLSKRGRVLTPTEPWESYALLAYITVLEAPPAANATARDFRLYYDCLSRAPAGSTPGFLRFMCLALSSDGVTWTKPRLGVATFNGSTDNNIVWPLSDAPGVYGYTEPNTVVLNDAPGRASDMAFIMVSEYTPPGGTHTGTYAFASADGIAFRQLFPLPSLIGSDTKSILWWDGDLSSWIGFMRIDDALPNEHGGAQCGPAGGLSADIRRIGRCTFSDLASWNCNNTNASLVFSFDAFDPVCTDVRL